MEVQACKCEPNNVICNLREREKNIKIKSNRNKTVSSLKISYTRPQNTPYFLSEVLFENIQGNTFGLKIYL